MNHTINLAKAYPLFGTRFADGVLNAVSGVTNPPNDVELNSMKTGLVRYPQPLRIDQLYALKDISGHHSSCIQAKKYATVGLGFIDDGDEVDKAGTDEEAAQAAQSLLSGQGYVTSKVDDALDPLTHFGFSNELIDVAEDFMDCGTGYLEVCRKKGKITGISHIPAKDIWFCTYKGRIFFQYQPHGVGSPACRYWALFGTKNKDWLLSEEGPMSNFNGTEDDVSEIIPFIQPSNRTKYYGYPDWISATVDIDLLKKSKQYKADFYHNRGVLDKILIVTGESVDADAWKRIEDSIKGSIGGGNNFGSMALNFSNPESKVDVKNMGAEGDTEEQFAKDTETLTQNIVSSHGVPPLLANILIPGKLGASNEFINALISFQLLRINAYQNVFSKTLAKSLGSDDGIEGLNPEDFRLRTITSQINLNSLDTIGKMRSEATSGENKDRDLEEGVKK
jgi:capsid portal protein